MTLKNITMNHQREDLHSKLKKALLNLPSNFADPCDVEGKISIRENELGVEIKFYENVEIKIPTKSKITYDTQRIPIVEFEYKKTNYFLKFH